jgi:hypothetical protein
MGHVLMANIVVESARYLPVRCAGFGPPPNIQVPVRDKAAQLAWLPARSFRVSLEYLGLVAKEIFDSEPTSRLIRGLVRDSYSLLTSQNALCISTITP